MYLWVSYHLAHTWKLHLDCHVRLFTIPWTAARQVPLSMGFLRWEYWSLPFPSPGHLPNAGIKDGSPASAGRFLEVTSRLCIPASHISRLPCWSQLSRAWCVQWISSHLRFLTGSMFGSFIKPSTHGHCWFSPWNDPDLPTLRVSASLSLTFSVCVCFLGRLLSSTGIQSKGFAIFQGQFAPQRKAKSIFCLKGLFAF